MVKPEVQKPPKFGQFWRLLAQMLQETWHTFLFGHVFSAMVFVGTAHNTRPLCSRPQFA